MRIRLHPSSRTGRCKAAVRRLGAVDAADHRRVQRAMEVERAAAADGEATAGRAGRDVAEIAHPSSITMRCRVLSLLRNITVSPVEARTGLGWKAVLPEEPTTDTVTVVVAGGGGELLGAVGVEPPPPPPPQPQAAAARRAAARVPETSRDCMRDLNGAAD